MYFWRECGNEGVFDVLTKYSKCHDTYGLCPPVSKESNYFDYGIGKTYEDGDCISDTWDRIFKEFLPSSNYNMLDDTDFELYGENLNCFCEIWVPVSKKY